MTTKTLADHQDYRITLHPVENAKGVFVTFDAHDTDLADRGFGTKFVMGEGYTNIYVAQRRGTQYQGLSLDAFQAAVAPYCASQANVFTYGSSLGGYCAIYYAGVINAAPIAFSPRSSAHPLIMERSAGARKKFADVDFRHMPFGFPAGNKAPVISYDPRVDLDQLFIEDWVRARYPDSKLSVFEYAGHGTARALLRVGKLKAFFREAVAGRALESRGDAYESDITRLNRAKEMVAKAEYSRAASLLNAVLQEGTKNPVVAETMCFILRLTALQQSFDYKLLSYINHPAYHKGIFDERFYLDKYDDVRESPKMSRIPFLHFMVYGAFEGRKAGPQYDGQFYLDNNRDVIRAGMHPFAHYKRRGRKNGRVAVPASSLAGAQ